MRTLIALSCLGLASCAAPPPLPPKADAPQFDPARFFAGKSAGAGTLHLPFSDRTIAVRSVGRPLARGGFRLDQAIREGDKAPRTRRWIVRKTGQGRWAGSLSDADGPVTLVAEGNELRIAYAMPNGLAVAQRLRLLPGGRVAANRLTVSKWGFRVATLDETIRKLD